MVGCNSSNCPDELQFEVSAAGGNYQYCNWKFEIPPGTVSKTTTITIKKSLTMNIKSKTLVGFENPQTHELDPVELELDTAPGYETIEFSLQDPTAFKDPLGIAVCPGAELLVAERFGGTGTDITASPVDQLQGKNPCFQLYQNQTQDKAPVYLSAASTDWSDAWNRLLNSSQEIYNKYLQGYLVVDPCVMCSYGGFQLASYLVPSDCQNFTKDLICNATLPIVAAALPLVLVPPLKQGLCAASKVAITSVISYATSAVSDYSFNSICNVIDYSGATFSVPAVKDVFGCSFQKSCDAITTCTAESLNSKWIKNNLGRCSEIGF